MAEKKITAVVDIETKEAQQNVEKLNDKLDETTQKTKDVNKEAKKAASGVEGWGTAFEVAFDTADQAAGGLGGSLKEVVDSTRGAIPVVKNLNSTALKGLKGIKGAIAATGIGLLITAVGLVASHWEGFTHAVGLSSDKFKEFKATAVDVLKNIVSGAVGVGNVLLQFLLTPVRTAIEAFKGLGNVIKDVFTLNWGDIGDHASSALSGIQDAFKKGFDISGNFEAGKEAGERFMQGVVTTFTYKKEEISEAAGSAGKAAGESFKNEALEEAKKFVSELEKALDPANKVVAKIFDSKALENEIKSILGQYEGMSEATAKSIAGVRAEAEKNVGTLDTAITELEKKLGELNTLRTTTEDPEAAQEYEQAYQSALTSLESYRQARLDVIADAELKETEIVQEFRTKRQQEQDAALKAQQDAELQAKQDQAEKEKSILESRLEAYYAFSDAMTSIIDSVVDAEAEQIEKELALGKISQEEAEERFNQLKGWQIASTWIRVLAGMTAALTSPAMQAMGIPGWIAAGAQAAALLADGIISTKKIAETEFGQGGEGGSVGSSISAGATPIQMAEDISPTPTMNVPVSSEESRVYILESDIQKSNNRVKVRESNTSF